MDTPDTDRRSPDQDTAIEEAFVAGTLPEEDRRSPEEIAADNLAAIDATPPGGVIHGLTLGRPFPHDLTTPHALDNLPVGTTITKDSASTVTIEGPGGTSGQSIAPDDALQHLPIGATVTIGEPGKATTALVVLPQTAERGQVSAFGHRFHEALAAAWRWIATDFEPGAAE